MKLATRIRRSARVARTGVHLWSIYKIPAFARRCLFRPPRPLDATHHRAAQALLRCALDLRGVIIKMCQAVATRADVFPPPFIETLKQCHDAVPPKPFPQIAAVVESELGKPLDALF
ncbi:MAG: AarF/ABC1/UbiB kinase family protein, partial [Myxococcota bacterium]